MGATDIERQQPNVFRMKLLGAEVMPVTSGSKTLNDALNEALRDWTANLATTHYLLGTVCGPHPFPTLVRELQKVIGVEAREQWASAVGGLPDAVVACVGGDRQGRIYNVNADQMAVSCASGFRADRLFFLTDVDGVKGADGAVIPTLTLAESQKLIADGVATGGMQAKLNAAGDALTGGVGEVIIAPGAAPDIVARLMGGEAVGTRFVRG